VKKIYIARDPLEAEFIKSFLSSADIAATVRDTMLWGTRGVLPMTTDTLPSIWVEDQDVEKAESLLAELAQTLPPATEDMWICRSCGERHDGQFSACWKCGASGN